MVALPPLTRRRAALLFGDETGAATAEYAIATMAAVAFAGLLVVIMRSPQTNRSAAALAPPCRGSAKGMVLAPDRA
ncbi:DUF4244 domain-containing protein [Microbacterium sp. 22303]|uniref:DUF4244 domain-containing protein n=1 Tax=Microbacterium sp. 22303 TaxID=3453905 RepID=UPI003F82930E